MCPTGARRRAFFEDFPGTESVYVGTCRDMYMQSIMAHLFACMCVGPLCVCGDLFPWKLARRSGSRTHCVYEQPYNASIENIKCRTRNRESHVADTMRVRAARVCVCVMVQQGVHGVRATTKKGPPGMNSGSHSL